MRMTNEGISIPLLGVPNPALSSAILNGVFKNVIELNLLTDNCNDDVMLE